MTRRWQANQGWLLVLPTAMGFLVFTREPSLFGPAEIEFSGGWVLSWIPQPVTRKAMRMASRNLLA